MQLNCMCISMSFLAVNIWMFKSVAYFGAEFFNDFILNFSLCFPNIFAVFSLFLTTLKAFAPDTLRLHVFNVGKLVAVVLLQIFLFFFIFTFFEFCLFLWKFCKCRCHLNREMTKNIFVSLLTKQKNIYLRLMVIARHELALLAFKCV